MVRATRLFFAAALLTASLSFTACDRPEKQSTPTSNSAISIKLAHSAESAPSSGPPRRNSTRSAKHFRMVLACLYHSRPQTTSLQVRALQPENFSLISGSLHQAPGSRTLNKGPRAKIQRNKGREAHAHLRL
jgi:hypothetical protein